MNRIALSICILFFLFSLSACGHRHTWTEATCEHHKSCSTCGETAGAPLEHDWVEATCIEPKICLRCGKEEGDSLGHAVNSWTVTVEPTCSSRGRQTGTCSVCGDTVEEYIKEIEHTQGEWKIVREPTISKEGSKAKYCTVCGKELEEEKISLSPEEYETKYKQECQEYSFEEIARNPEKYVDTYGKYTGKIIQVIEDGNNFQYRINTVWDGYGYYDGTIYAFYTRKPDEGKFLEDDVVTIYGQNQGTVTYESVLGAEITLPCVSIEYIELN